MDEALDAAKTISAGNINACLLVLGPQIYSTQTAQATVKNRRLLEDKLLASEAQITECKVVAYVLLLLSSFLMQEISLTYSDSGHAGDRRKRSQICISALSFM